MFGHQGVALSERLGGMALLGVGLKVSKAQARPSGLFFPLPADPDVEFSATSPAPCLLVHCQVPHHDDNGLHF